MKELNLEVGQKCWSIQLGDCEVTEVNRVMFFPITCQSKDGRSCGYLMDGKDHSNAFYRSLFESNPFEQKLVQENKDGWIEPKENKAELINALCSVIAIVTDTEMDKIAKDKLQKLLESI